MPGQRQPRGCARGCFVCAIIRRAKPKQGVPGMNSSFDNQPSSDGSEILSTCSDSSAIEHVFCEPHGRCKRPDCEVCEWINAKRMVGTVDGLTFDTMNMLSITLTL